MTSPAPPPGQVAGMPRAWPYFLAAMLAGAGVALGAWLIAHGVRGLAKMAGPQFVVPGRHAITLAEPGRYVIYHEAQAVVGGRTYTAAPGAPGLTCTLLDKSTGRQVPLAASMASTTYSLGGRSGRSLLQFRVDRPGEYELSVDYGQSTGPPTVVAVGRGFSGRGLAAILSACLVLPAFLLAGLIIALVTFLRRMGAKRRLSRAG